MLAVSRLSFFRNRVPSHFKQIATSHPSWCFSSRMEDFMQSGRRVCFASTLFTLCGALSGLTAAAGPLAVTQLCNVKILANETVASPKQRSHAGQIAEPPLSDAAD